MAVIATFDLGTTALKCVVLDEKQKIYFSGKEEIETKSKGNFIEQDPDAWWSAFVKLSKRFDAAKVDYLIFSGQMQDLYFLDKEGRPIGNAVLYSDQRGAGYVSALPSAIARETCIPIDGSIPLAKVLWFKENRGETLAKAYKLLISAKDYLVLKLTGEYVSDEVNMSTSGMMNIKTKEYVNLEGLVDTSLLPPIKHPDEIAGKVTNEASEETGYRSGIEVFTGSGDAGATTLASAVSAKGEFSVNLGTSGWIATLSLEPVDGIFNLAAINRGLYINVIPILNGANVHNWVSRLLFSGDEKRYDKLHKLLEESEEKDLLCLPYLVGERFPVSDEKVRGVFLGLDEKTTGADLARAALEGVAFSLKSGFDCEARRVTLIGGGGAESLWCQIFADVFGAPVTVFEDSEVLPSLALSSLVLYRKGFISSYTEFVEEILSRQKSHVYKPRKESVRHYEAKLERFKRVYPAVKTLF